MNSCEKAQIELMDFKHEAGWFDNPRGEWPMGAKMDYGARKELKVKSDNSTAFLTTLFTAGIASGCNAKCAVSMRVTIESRQYTVVCVFARYYGGMCRNHGGIQIRAGTGAEDEKGRLGSDAHGVVASGAITSINDALTNPHSGINHPSYYSFFESSNHFSVSMYFNNTEGTNFYVTFGPSEDPVNGFDK